VLDRHQPDLATSFPSAVRSCLHPSSCTTPGETFVGRFFVPPAARGRGPLAGGPPAPRGIQDSAVEIRERVFVDLMVRGSPL
jgi:hypothetical protein